MSVMSIVEVTAKMNVDETKDVKPVTREEQLRHLASVASNSVADAKAFLRYLKGYEVSDVIVKSIYHHPSFQENMESCRTNPVGFEAMNLMMSRFPPAEEDLAKFRSAFAKEFNHKRLLMVDGANFTFAVTYPAYLDVSEEITKFMKWTKENGYAADVSRPFSLMSTGEPQMAIRVYIY